MSKNIIIENSKGVKLYPITKSENIIGLKNIGKEELEKKLNKEYVFLDEHSFDSVKDTGFYQIKDEKTSPSKTPDNYLMYVGVSNSVIFQHAVNTWTGDAYTRSHNTQGWTEWKEISSDVGEGIFVDSSATGTVSTSKDRSVISSSSSNATSKNSTIIASEGSKTNQVRSAVIASRNSETDGAHYSNRSGNVILASHGVKTPSDSKNLVVGGCASDRNATPSTSNINWQLDGFNGKVWARRDIEIGDMSIKNKLEGLSNSSTIVIANHDSHPNSKANADIVINRGENASKKINQAIQSLKDTGGEVKLMEGNYNLEYGIAVNVDGVHLTGIPKATILVQNKTWKDNPFNNDREHVVDTWRESSSENVNVEISNIYMKGVNISGSYGFYCSGSSKITNCISENSGSEGFRCRDSSKITNCISEKSGSSGFYCLDSSKVTNCISENSGFNGFSCSGSSKVTNCISGNSGFNGFNCTDSSKITNCISENSGFNGFHCISLFKGICGHNTLVGDKLRDDSSSPAIVQYNIIQEGV